MKTKHIALILALSLACSCAACGKKDTDTTGATADASDAVNEAGTEAIDAEITGTEAENVDAEITGTEAGIADIEADTPATEAGTTDAEAGTADTEAGTTSTEAGTADTEAGTTSTEAGTTSTEAGTADMEAGTADTEAGTSDAQAGTVGTEAGTVDTEAATEAIAVENETETESSPVADVTVADYSDMDNWAMYAEGEGDADVFFVCPTVDMGSDSNYNMRLDDETTKGYFLGASKMELGIYDENVACYVPYYKQVTFPVYYLEEEESQQYFEIAYNDVKAAFEYYLAECDPERPLILAGFSQGADMVIRLVRDYFEDEDLQDRLVAAYAIGWKLTKEEVEENPWMVPAEGETDTGCIITFSSEAEDITESLIVSADTWTYSINPLNWETDSTPADASLNVGACFTNYDGEITSEIPALTGAYIDETRGTLKCPDINPTDYSNSMFPDGVYHLYDYQFFYRNLQQNVAARLAAWEEAR